MRALHNITIDQASSQIQIAIARELFLEYAASLGISLCFQNFDQELAELPGKYAPPAGRLFLALDHGEAAGCVALRPLVAGVCEMKRLYVKPAWRGNGLGRLLAEATISAAEQIGYARMLLDTLSSLKAAISLYHSLGFHEVPAYYDNPSDNVVFMERLLHPVDKHPGPSQNKGP